MTSRDLVVVEEAAVRWDRLQYARYRDECSRPFGDLLASVDLPSTGPGASDRIDLLADHGLAAEVCETTCLHALPGAAVGSGDGLRPALAALAPVEAAEFEQQYALALRAAYPAGAHGTPFAFRRIFAVEHRLGGTA